ncbi:MAG: GTP-binding protein [Oscillospiraceae bacterium]|nr:GTP-binding protein [Oscillospiraceae bacterium]
MNNSEQNDLNIVIVGHVDHGKSTVIGRLLADTDSLPLGKLEQIKEMCRRNSKPFEYAFLLDALKDERSQGITIDTARSFFKTEKRRYIIIDAPGHIEFLKNMITGASRAEAALLVIDANEGIQENSRRHGYMLSMLGISQIAVLVNKMDLINYNKKIYNNIVNEYSQFLRKININPMAFIPVSAMRGDNIASKSKNMTWFDGMTVLETLDNFNDAKQPDDLPFRMSVQDVYKFTAANDDRRIIAGTVDSGILRVNDEIIFYPSGKKTTVKSIEEFNAAPKNYISSGYASGFTVTEQIYIKRGELCVKSVETEKIKPFVSTTFKASLFWLGKEPMDLNKIYSLKIGSSKVDVKLKKIIKVINASSLDEIQTNGRNLFVGRDAPGAPQIPVGVADTPFQKGAINRHEVAECILETERPIAFDTADIMPLTSRFVIVDRYEISGGGIITENIGDEYSEIREKVLLRNFKWERGNITPAMRAERFCQKACMLIITGNQDADKKIIAKTLEQDLFNEGRIAYYLGIGNVLYGVDSDIKNIYSNAQRENREEHIRRLSEVANILLETGAILIVTATMLTQDDMDLIKTVLTRESEGDIITYWIGKNIDTDIKADIIISDFEDSDRASLMIKKDLQDRNIIYN